MVLVGGLMTYAQISGGQTGASSVGTADAITGTELDDNDNLGACGLQSVDEPDPAQNEAGRRCAMALRPLFEQGKAIFRFDTFGDEDYWGGTLALHKAIEGAALGGVGPGVSPKTALTVAGLKVDVDALPRDLQVKPQARQGRPRQSCDHARAPEAERCRRRQGLFRQARFAQLRSASPAPFAIRPSTTRSPRESASGWTAGRTRTWTPV